MRTQYKYLTLFLLIAFLIPLICIVAQTIISNNFIRFIFYGIQAASPTISAIITLYFQKDKTSLIKMFSKKHLKMAIFLPIVIACMTMFLAKLIFCMLFKINFTFGHISIIQFIIISWTFIAEEIGWRGYLEPLLKINHIYKQIIPCIVGMIWCLWHYHYFLQKGIDVPVLLFLISCIIESYIYSFLMRCTDNNIISTMTYHFAWNLFLHIFAVNPSDNNGNIFPYIILNILETLVMLLFWNIKKTNNKISPIQ